jgi:hypothetical protein
MIRSLCALVTGRRWLMLAVGLAVGLVGLDLGYGDLTR